MQCVTVVLFLFGLSGNIQPIPLASSLGALILFVVIEKYVARDPIIPLTVLQNRGALLSCIAQLGLSELFHHYSHLHIGPVVGWGYLLAIGAWEAIDPSPTLE